MVGNPGLKVKNARMKRNRLCNIIPTIVLLPALLPVASVARPARNRVSFWSQTPTDLRDQYSKPTAHSRLTAQRKLDRRWLSFSPR